MTNIYAIWWKETRSYFNSFMAYALMALYLAINGLFFAFYVATSRQASLTNLWGTMAIILLFVLPFLTMRLLAEEEYSGTMELLMTAPVRDWEVVVGKYLAALTVMLAMIGCTLWYVVMLFRFGNPDPGPIASGYLGLILLGGTVLAIGVLFSSLTRYQLVAGVGALFTLLALWVIDIVSSIFADPRLGDFVREITLNGRAQDMWRGLINTKDIIFFLSVIIVTLFITSRIVESRRWR
jgi:ABC-2 type transport system permease protein